MRKNRKCICCSAEYFYCPDCGGADKLKPSWYTEFCGVDCKDLWMTATKFNMGLIEKDEAREIISSLNLKDKSEYVECVQHDLENLMAKSHKQHGKRAELNIIDDKVTVDKSHAVVIEKENK